MANFEDALRDNRVPPRLGDIRLRYDGGRLVGESLPPPWERRMLPSLCVGVALGCALGAMLLVGWEGGAFPIGSAALAAVAASLVGAALWLESKLGRRRFVLHFGAEALRWERLAWTPGATRSEWVPFDAVKAVHIVERPGPRYAVVVEYEAQKAGLRRLTLVENVRAAEGDTLHRVWRMLSNAFGLRGAGLA